MQRESAPRLKDLVAQAPALRLPNLTKPFRVYIHERDGIALGGINPEARTYFSADGIPLKVPGPNC